MTDRASQDLTQLQNEIAALRQENARLRKQADADAVASKNAQSDLERQAQELARSNAMLSALGQVAARVATTFDPDLVMRTLGEELNRLGINSAVALADADSGQLRLHHVAVDSALLALAERLVGMHWRDFALTPDLWLLFRTFSESKAFYIADASPLARGILPAMPRWLVERASSLVGVKPGVAAICAPLVFGDHSIGALALWGESLREDDLSAVTLFANQVSVAIQNAQLYSASVERADELAHVSENLRQELAARAETERGLRASQRILELQNRIANVFLTSPDEAMYAGVLAIVLETLSSRYGIFGYINEHGDLVTPSMTRDIWEECQMADKTIVFPRSSWGGIWGRALIEGRTFYSNDPLPTPPGHVPITRAVSAPIIHAGEVVGILTVGNKPEGYTSEDISLQERIAEMIAPVLHARLQRDREEARRRQAEEALRESRRAADTLFSNLPGMAYRCKNDPDWTMEFVSEGCLALCGYRADDLIDNRVISYAQIIHPDDRQLVADGVDQGLRDKAFFAMVYRIVAADGAIKWVWERGRGVYDESGALIALEGFITDITERVRAEESLRDRERRYRLLVENAPLGILAADLDGRILEANPTLAKILGSPSVEATKAINVFTFAPLAEAGFVDDARRCIASGEAFVAERPYTSKWGKQTFLRCYFTPVRDEMGSIIGMQAIVEDTSETRQLEEQLRQAQKMEAIGRLAGGVAHDFNNLLTVINGYSELMLGSLNPDDVLYQEASEINQAGLRAAELTSQLLAFSRRQIVEMRVLDLNSVIEGMGKMLQRLLGEDIALQLVFAPDLGSVRADRGQIEQIIANLAINARDAMPTGGALTIKTANVSLGPDHVADHIELSPGDYVMLAVQDTGVGMTDQVKEHLFEPFFTTKEVGKGTGLGLAMVYGVVRQFGGDIDVQSAPGEGALFRIYLPRIEESADGPTQIPLDNLPRGAETILVVEDQDDVRRLVTSFLQRLGYAVVAASGPSEALARCMIDDLAFDLVVSDVIMPEMSGPELVARLRESRPGLRVLYMSGYAAESIAERATIGSQALLLFKPFTIQSLAHGVRQALEAD